MEDDVDYNDFFASIARLDNQDRADDDEDDENIPDPSRDEIFRQLFPNSRDITPIVPAIPATQFDTPPPAPVQPILRPAHHNRCPTCNQTVKINVDLNRKCPQCNKQVVIRKNRTNHEDFIGCSGYPNCRWTMSVRKYLLWTEPNGRTEKPDDEERKIFI